MSVVPGGRIEAGETFDQTAVREVHEETGLEVRVVRDVGVEEQPSWRVHGVRDENQLLPEMPWSTTARVDARRPALPLGPAAESTFGVRGCTATSCTRVLRKRVVAYVTRGRELLVFDHDGKTHVPAGRVDHDETLEEGLAREVEEETGVTGIGSSVSSPGRAEVARLHGTGGNESHAFHAVTDARRPRSGITR